MTWAVPSIGGIQWMTAAVAASASALLFVSASPSMAIGCAVGATVMIVNLSLLAMIGRWMIELAAGQGGASRLGIIAAPLKLLFIITVVALLLSRTRLDVIGFVLGALTQLGAIFLETLRVSMRPRVALSAEAKTAWK